MKFETPIERTSPCSLQLDQRPPRLGVLADAGVGPVDEVQVEVVEPEPLAATPCDAGDRRRRTRGARPGILLVTSSSSRGTPERRIASPTSRSLLVVHGRVEQPVADLERADDRRDARPRRAAGRCRSRSPGSAVPSLRVYVGTMGRTYAMTLRPPQCGPRAPLVRYSFPRSAGFCLGGLTMEIREVSPAHPAEFARWHTALVAGAVDGRAGATVSSLTELTDSLAGAVAREAT